MGAAFAAALLLAFSPLILSGILDDFLGNLVRLANKVGTSTNTAGKIIAFVMQFFELKVTVPWLMLILGLSSQNLRPMQRLMLTWVVAFGGILFYRTVHPLDLDYLGHPLRLVGAVCLAVLVHMVLNAWLLVPSMKKLGVGSPFLVSPCRVGRFMPIRKLATISCGPREAGRGRMPPWIWLEIQYYEILHSLPVEGLFRVTHLSPEGDQTGYADCPPHRLQ